MYKIKFGFFPPVTLSYARVPIRLKNPEARRGGGLPTVLVVPDVSPRLLDTACYGAAAGDAGTSACRVGGLEGAHRPCPSRESGWQQTESPGVEPVAKAPDEHSTFLSVLRPADGHCLCLSCVSHVTRRKSTGRDAGTGPTEPSEEPAYAAFTILSRPASAWADFTLGPLCENGSGFLFVLVYVLRA